MRIVVAQSILSSVVMGLYMHLVFWGGLSIGPYTIINPITPEVSFWSCLWLIGMPSALYLFSQALPVAARPQMFVWLLFADWAASMFPIAEVYLVVIRSVFITYTPSTFQLGAMMVWMWTEAVDLLFFVISALLLRRSIGFVEPN